MYINIFIKNPVFYYTEKLYYFALNVKVRGEEFFRKNLEIEMLT